MFRKFYIIRSGWVSWHVSIGFTKTPIFKHLIYNLCQYEKKKTGIGIKALFRQEFTQQA